MTLGWRQELREDGTVALPQTREVTDADGFRWWVTVDRGRLTLTGHPDGPITFDDPAELRWIGPQLTRAVAEHDIDAADRRARGKAQAHQRAILDRLPTGDPYRRYEDRRPA